MNNSKLNKLVQEIAMRIEKTIERENKLNSYFDDQFESCSFEDIISMEKPLSKMKSPPQTENELKSLGLEVNTLLEFYHEIDVYRYNKIIPQSKEFDWKYLKYLSEEARKVFFEYASFTTKLNLIKLQNEIYFLEVIEGQIETLYSVYNLEKNIKQSWANSNEIPKELQEEIVDFFLNIYEKLN